MQLPVQSAFLDDFQPGTDELEDVLVAMEAQEDLGSDEDLLVAPANPADHFVPAEPVAEAASTGELNMESEASEVEVPHEEKAGLVEIVSMVAPEDKALIRAAKEDLAGESAMAVEVDVPAVIEDESPVPAEASPQVAIPSDETTVSESAEAPVLEEEPAAVAAKVYTSMEASTANTFSVTPSVASHGSSEPGEAAKQDARPAPTEVTGAVPREGTELPPIETPELAPTEATEPAPTEVSGPVSREGTELPPSETAELAPTKALGPVLREETEPAPSETAELAQTETTGPVPQEGIEPALGEVTEPVPRETAKLATSEATELTTSEDAGPRPSEVTEAAPTDAAKPALCEATEPAPNETTETSLIQATGLAPSEDVELATKEAMEPAIDQDVEPEPHEATGPGETVVSAPSEAQETLPTWVAALCEDAAEGPSDAPAPAIAEASISSEAAVSNEASAPAPPVIVTEIAIATIPELPPLSDKEETALPVAPAETVPTKEAPCLTEPTTAPALTDEPAVAELVQEAEVPASTPESAETSSEVIPEAPAETVILEPVIPAEVPRVESTPAGSAVLSETGGMTRSHLYI